MGREESQGATEPRGRGLKVLVAGSKKKSTIFGGFPIKTVVLLYCITKRHKLCTKIFCQIFSKFESYTKVVCEERFYFKST